VPQPEPSALPPNPDGLVPSATDLRGAPIYTRFMRLTNTQWSRAVKELLHLPTAPDSSTLEREVYGTTEFVNNEQQLAVSNTQWERYELLTEDLVKQVTATDAALASVQAGTDSTAFIKAFGRRAYRRPLTDAEVTKFEAIYDTGAALSGSQAAFTKGAGLVIEAMLQSPYFLYRTELGAAGQPLNDFEIASKLSFWLRGTIPTDALLDKAAAGKLKTADAVVAEAKAMLELPEATEMMRAFHGELLEVRRLTDLTKSDPAYDAGMNAEVVATTNAFFDHLFTEGLGFKQLLTATEGFVGPKTAALYGLPAPTALKLQDFGAARTGFFAQVPYLMLWGTLGGQADSIHRGARLQEKVLCGVLGLPSDIVALNEPLPNQTNRQRVDASTGLNTCGASCHGHYINPLGFSLENFDGLGRERTTDNSLPVDTTGSYPFQGETVKFNGHAELMTAMAGNKMAYVCYAKHVAGYALQRDIVESDKPVLEEMATLSMNNGSIKDMVLDLVKNPAFRVRAGGAQ
jgi:Protein of unknown function (DUF1592)/Protein of unknown function (DUF1595)/Protein of unknown function (DUF1588)/Protein of unknown function (DUF1585)/Protein of unknown function (DUF1587)